MAGELGRVSTKKSIASMQSSIKVIAEGHAGIISRLDSMGTRIGTVESELHTVKMVVYDIDSRLTKVEHKIDTSIEQNEIRFRQIDKKLALV